MVPPFMVDTVMSRLAYWARMRQICQKVRDGEQHDARRIADDLRQGYKLLTDNIYS
jgi:hypothetical protein